MLVRQARWREALHHGLLGLSLLAVGCNSEHEHEHEHEHEPASPVSGGAALEAASSPPTPTPEPRAQLDPAAIDPVRELLLATARIAPGMVIAEIGASGGWFVDRAALAVGVDGHVYATDINPEAIAALNKLAAVDNPARSPVDVRLCANPRETGLDDLPDAHIDLMLMIDSLCFEGGPASAEDEAYLREFLRLLEPGGRLLHHMDCQCEPPVADLIALFEAAGFRVTTQQLELEPGLVSLWAGKCSTPSQRERLGLVLSLRKPG